MTTERLAQIESHANAGARFPVVRSIGFGTLSVATHVFGFTAEQPGKIRAVRARSTFPNTATINVAIAGTSVLPGGTADSLTTNVNYDVPFDAAAELEYAAGDEVTVTLVIGTGAATAGLVEITSDERQPAVI